MKLAILSCSPNAYSTRRFKEAAEQRGHKAKVLNFQTELARQNTTLDFDPPSYDRVAAYFHTGGTTGIPKIAQHKYSGMIYNGWLGATLLFDEEAVIASYLTDRRKLLKVQTSASSLKRGRPLCPRYVEI